MRKTLSHILVATALLFGTATGLTMPAAAAPNAQKQAEDLAIQGLDLSDKGDYAGAVDKFRQALVLDPKDKGLKQNLVEQLTNLGISLYNAKNYPDAIVKLKEAAGLSPKYKAAVDNLALATAAQATIDGNALYKAGNLEGAKAKYAEGVAADPTSVGAKANLATVEADIFEKADDVASLTQAVAKRQEAVKYAPDKTSLVDKLNEAQAKLTAAQAKAAEAEKNKK